MLSRSIRCHVLGWWSLVPLIGIIPAVLALTDFYAVTLRKGELWNAARGRLTAGALLAGVGLLLGFITGSLLVILLLNRLIDG